jgi:hypothetical protein
LVVNKSDWDDFNKNGHIQDDLLTRIWNSGLFEITSYYKRDLLKYMERLGLIYIGQEAHYIPCMNKRKFHKDHLKNFPNQTSVLVFRFSFLPYFVYFRLIVTCLTKTEWDILYDNGLCLFKDVACFIYKEHRVVLAVNRYSIQLQILQPSTVLIRKDVTLEIRDTIETILNGLTSSFHRKIMYTAGYQCSQQDVHQEHDDCFVEERKIHRKGAISCPIHGTANHHILRESFLSGFWKQVP